jgi:hypothetical protein
MTRLPMSRVFRDRKATATVELALIAPIFATLLIGVVDMTMAVNRKIVLEQATQRGIEKIMQTTLNETVDTTIVQEAASAAGVDQSKVTLNYWLKCDGVKKDSYSDDCTSTQIETRYITLAITDEFTPLFPLARLGIAGSTLTIKAESGIRTR